MGLSVLQADELMSKVWRRWWAWQCDPVSAFTAGLYREDG